MSERAKTSVYVGVAAVLAIIAVATRPRFEKFEIQEQVGKPLFPEFQDPSAAASLEIVRFDESLGEIHRFEVRKKKLGDAEDVARWVIATHSDYPADAEDQMKEAATALIDLRVLGVASEVEGDHALYGVIEPDKEKLKVGDEGVGLMVAIQDAKNRPLARLIIGNAVKGAEGQRFVRIPGQTPVYLVEIDPEKFSTKFEDWIEKDLLQLNAWDVRRLQLKDYSVLSTSDGRFGLDRRFDITADWDSEESQWRLNRMVVYRGPKQEPEEASLGENEELNTSKLNDLKYALDDLEIVDVRRKPEGLGADLSAGNEFLNNQESINSLVQRGFYPLSVNGRDVELLSANGEVVVGMNNGVEYVLRFGNIASADTTGEESKLNRYLFVTARFNQDYIPKPELEPLPPLEDQPESEEKQAGADGEDDNGDSPQQAAADTESAQQKESAADGSDAETNDEQDADEPAAEDASEENGDPDAADVDDAERERIRKENKRKQDEYDEKVEEGKRKVRELNARFADWYYVISEDVYKKIHLSRADIITETEEAKEEGFGVDAFRKLQEEGLEGGQEEDSSDEDSGGAP